MNKELPIISIINNKITSKINLIHKINDSNNSQIFKNHNHQANNNRENYYVYQPEMENILHAIFNDKFIYNFIFFAKSLEFGHPLILRIFSLILALYSINLIIL